MGNQAFHAGQALVEAGIEVSVGQLAHRRFQLEHRQHLPQFVMHFPGDTGFLFFTNAFQVRRQIAQLFLGAGQLQLGPLALGNVPDHAVPDHAAIAQATGTGLDISPALLTLAGQDAPLPGPVAVSGQGQVLDLVVIGPVIRVNQVAQAHVRML
ncbi:hypothetical protein D3C72_1712860 [compost metagenome]